MGGDSRPEQSFRSIFFVFGTIFCSPWVSTVGIPVLHCNILSTIRPITGGVGSTNDAERTSRIARVL